VVVVAALVLQSLGSAHPSTRLGVARAIVEGQTTRPLPDSKTFFDAVRQNLARSQDQQKLYAYKERRTDLNLNPFGRLGTGITRVVDVTPTPDGAVNRRLLERDGQPVVNSPVVRRESRMPTGRSMVDDVASVLDVVMDRRDMLNGRPAIVVRFHGRTDASPRTREGRIARAFSGLIWIDEEAKEVARVDATAVDDISFGYGMLARLNNGSTVVVRRESVDRDLWLPTSVRFTGEGRALLFRKLTINFAVDWFDYRRAL
jgi:hypothetical protein